VCARDWLCGFDFHPALGMAICHAFGMQLKVWAVHKHPSHLGMQLKYPVYQKLCTLMQVLSTVVALAVSL